MWIFYVTFGIAPNFDKPSAMKLASNGRGAKEVIQK